MGAMFLTTVVGADWMMRSSAEEWWLQDQEYIAEMQEVHKFDDQSAEKLHTDLVNAMTAMLEVTHKKTLESDAPAGSYSGVPNREPASPPSPPSPSYPPSPPQFTMPVGTLPLSGSRLGPAEPPEGQRSLVLLTGH